MRFYLHFTQFREPDRLRSQADIPVHKDRAVGLPAAFTAFEPRISRFLPREEVPESIIQMPQALLQGDAVRFFQEGLFLFQLCQVFRAVIVRQGPAGLFVTLSFHSKVSVVDQPDTAEGFFDEFPLRLVRVYAEFKGSVFHGSNTNVRSFLLSPFYHRRTGISTKSIFLLPYK